MYVVTGRGRVWEEDRPTPVTVGDVVVITAGVPHATVNTGEESLRLVCFFPLPDLANNTEELDAPLRT